jgi:hypothetical protein
MVAFEIAPVTWNERIADMQNASIRRVFGQPSPPATISIAG